MATIEIPDSMVPEGWEVDTDGSVEFVAGSVGKSVSHITVRVGCRRKPRLKQIVFTVADKPRAIKEGEPFITSGGVISYGPFDLPRFPLTRAEVYE